MQRSAYACLAALFILTVIVQGTFTVDAVRNLMSDYPRPPFRIGRPWPSIRDVSQPSESGAVKTGQRVIAIDGQAPHGTGALARALRERHPGEALPVSVEQDGRVIEDRFVLVADVDQLDPLFLFYSAITWFLMPWLSIGLGFWVTALRPRDYRAWLVLGILLGVSQMNRPELLNPQGWPAAVAGINVAYRDVSIMGWACCMMLFGMYFPHRWRFDRLVPWLKWVLIVPLVAFAVRGAISDVILIGSYELSLKTTIPIPGFLPMVLISFTIGLFFAGLWDKHRDPALPADDRRRMGLLYWGCNAALTPFFLLMIYTAVRFRRMPHDAEGLLLVVAVLLIFLFPVTMAYVLVVQRAMNVQVVVRQGVQYTLARGGIIVIQAGVTIGIILLAANVLGSTTISRPSRLAMVAAGVVIILRLREGGDRLRRWLDRRFFREAYNAEHILGELSEQVRSILDRHALLETVTRKISESLHVEKAAVMLLDGGMYRPAMATGYAGALDFSVPPDAPAVNQLRRTREPVQARPGEMPELESELLLPLASRKELLGFISLGPKMSEEPYSPSDANLLRTVAAQTGLALENSRLSEAIAAEVAERELLNREIEIAREVQQRLFPQNSPEVAAIEYAGYCRPARGVGGDYYDFLALPGGRLGLVIADVSGKGVPAALLMASLQASVRGQSQSGSGSIAELTVNVNRLVCDASPENRYATFFYSQFDPATRNLVYTNGGHNNPILLRGSEVILLEEGGPPVGLFRFSRYTQGEIQLQSGDLLVLYTDGVSEAENPAEEEWGENALIETARAHRDSPPETISRIMEAADRFAAGAPQHDDMTLVVARILPLAD